MTLAYVFWHWTVSEIAPYLEALRAFHGALAAHPAAGSGGSDSATVKNAPWIPDGAGFEDRYFVESFGALGALNEAAVSGPRRSPHDRAASRAAGGCAGVYLLRNESAAEPSEGFAFWFGKPPNMPYESLFESLRPALAQADVALWQRQMTLGPTPEFCLRSPREGDRASLPPAIAVPFRRVIHFEALDPNNPAFPQA